MKTRGAIYCGMRNYTLLVLIFLLLVQPGSQAQINENNLWITNGTVSSIVQQGEMIYVGGSFTTVGRRLPYGVMLSSANGEVNYNSAIPDGIVRSVISDGASGFYISGDFKHVGSTVRAGVAHILSDGSVSSFNPIIVGEQKKVVAVSSGVVFITFQVWNAQAKKYNYFLRCYNSYGTMQWESTADGSVQSAVIKNNVLYITGGFSAIDGTIRKRLAAIDIITGDLLSWNTGNLIEYNISSIDASDTELFVSYYDKILTFNLNTGVAGVSIPIFSDFGVNKLLIHGNKLYATISSGELLVFNANTKDKLPLPDAFKNETRGAFNLTSDKNTIYLSGSFKGDTRHLMAFDATSHEILPFTARFLAAYGGSVASFSAVGGNVYVGGTFKGIDAQDRNGLFSYNHSTGELSSFAPVIKGSVIRLFATPLRLFATGLFTTVNGQSRPSGIASFDLPSGALSSWNPEFVPSALQPSVTFSGDETTIYVRGPFTSVNGQARNRLCAFDVASGNLTSWNPQGEFYQCEIAVDANVVYVTSLDGYMKGKLYFISRSSGQPVFPPLEFDHKIGRISLLNNTLFVCGFFTSIVTGSQQIKRTGLAAIDLTTGQVNDWAPEIGSALFTSIAAKGESVYVGIVPSVSGPGSRVEAIDASTGQLTGWRLSLNSNTQVNTLHVTSESVLIGGSFTSIENLPMAYLASASPVKSNAITGNVFYDLNSNGIFDAGDKGASNTLIEVQPGNIYFPTNADGDYKVFTGQGEFTIKPVPPLYATSITPANRNVSFSAELNLSTDNNFAVEVPQVNDMSITVSSLSAARPGFALGYLSTYKNNGTLPRDGTVKLVLDPNILFISSTPAPTTISRNTLEFSYSALDPGSSGTIQLNLKVPADVNLLGQVLCTTASVFPGDNDVNPTDNTFNLSQTVTGSFDPNDKQVTPQGYGMQGFIPQSTPQLLYTIRFQNTGTATADNIFVKDQLDQHLDVSSFKMVASSHPASYVIENGEVTWQFNNIFLPDKTNDEPNSHGYIIFSIAPKPNLPIGTVIENTAHIYFDFNPPVITNTVVNTIKNPPYEVLELSMSQNQANRNEEVVVPVRVKSFNDVIGAQFAIAWDPEVATYMGVEQFGIPGLDASAFGTTKVANGELVFIWSDANIVSRSLSDNDPIFNIRFKLIGNYASNTSIAFSEQTLPIELVYKNYEVFNVKTSNGMLMINPDITLKGKVIYPNGEGVQGVVVNISGASSATSTTDSKGTYTGSLYPTSLTDKFTVAPSKTVDQDPINGIDVQDVALIRYHLLGTQPFTTPYQIIAADVNNSKTVSVLDITLVQSMILGTINSYPNTPLWAFIPSGHTFVTPLNPFPYPSAEDVTVASLETGKPVDFVAVKHGDVNQSRDNNQPGRVRTDEANFIIQQEMIIVENETEKIIQIPIQLKSFNDLSAFQFTLSWNKEKLEYIETIDRTNVSALGEHRTGEGLLTGIWDDNEGQASRFQSGRQLMMLKFKSLGGTYRDVSISNDITVTKVFDNQLKSLGHNVTWDELTNDDYRANITLFPNPFKEALSIEIYLPEEGEVEVGIADITGRNIRHEQIRGLKGKNLINLNGLDSYGNTLKAGVYIITVISPVGKAYFKVLKN